MRALALCLGLMVGAALPASASTITTEFNTSDGFVTGGTDAVTLAEGDFSVTFSGGQQQQMFNAPSYNQGPAAYLFLNGTFTGTSGNTTSGSNDMGLIDFNTGAEEVSFFAANQGNGAAVTLNVFGTDDTSLLGQIFVTSSELSLFVFNSLTFGGEAIGSIGIDLPGPVGNPPYLLAIDSFSASPVPLPAAFPLFGAGLAGLGLIRRRRMKVA